MKRHCGISVNAWSLHGHGPVSKRALIHRHIHQAVNDVVSKTLSKLHIGACTHTHTHTHTHVVSDWQCGVRRE